MRTVSALEVRKHFGQLLDEAARGERVIIERAGQPICALVPLSDLPETSEERIRRRLEAIADIRRMAARTPPEPGFDGAALIREQRRLRDEQILRSVEKSQK